MRYFLLCVLFLAACSDIVHTRDVGVDLGVLDGAPISALPINVYDIQDMRPETGEHKCSPAGYYTIYTRVAQNTCPDSIVKEKAWTKTSWAKSYWCMLYYWDNLTYLGDGKLLYCSYYMDMRPDGIESWANCTVYADNGKTKYCSFNFWSPFTKPH